MKAAVPASAELERELAEEVNKVLEAGPLAPWIFTDHQPFGFTRGDLYWSEPGESLYFLAEIAPVLPEELRTRVLSYMDGQRQAWAPERAGFIPLTKGARRERWSTTPELMKWFTDFKAKQYKDMYTSGRLRPYALYGLSRYYDLVGQKPEAEVWEAITSMMATQPRKEGRLDWREAEFGPEAVRINRAFAGMIGWARLADAAGDKSASAEGPRGHRPTKFEHSEDEHEKPGRDQGKFDGRGPSPFFSA